MNTLTKIQVKQRKQQNKEFKRLYKLATKTIRRLKEPKETKQELINDLLSCNNIDIMHYLGVIKPKTKAEYILLVNKWLEHEIVTYKYGYLLAYSPDAKKHVIPVNGEDCIVGGFEVISEEIRQHHRYLDLKNKIYNISEG